MRPRSPLDPARVDALAAELKRLALRGVDRAFESVGKEGEVNLRNLFRIAETLLSDDWHTNRTDALRKLMRSAIDNFPDGDEKISYTNVSWRWTAEALLPGAAPGSGCDVAVSVVSTQDAPHRPRSG